MVLYLGVNLSCSMDFWCRCCFFFLGCTLFLISHCLIYELCVWKNSKISFSGLQHGLANENTHLNEFEISQRINTRDHVTEDVSTSIEGQENNTSSEKEGFIRGSNFQKLGSDSNIKKNLSTVSTANTHEISAPAINKTRKRCKDMDIYLPLLIPCCFFHLCFTHYSIFEFC